MRIISAASAFPKYYYPQDLLLTALRDYWADELSRPETLDRLHSRACVDGRHLAYPMADYYKMNTFGDFNHAWMKAAEDLGAQSLCRALTQAGLAPQDIGAIFFVSVTGVCSPSIDAKLVNKLKLSPNIKRIPIFGLGCVAGAAGISRAADYVRAYPDEVAALVSVELCSLTLQKKDLSVANLISSGLFGDGAAAVLVSGANRDVPAGPEIVATRSTFYPDSEYVMGWDISEKGFQIVLSPNVPDVIREHLGQDVDSFLADHDLKRGDIASWIMHTGGPKVLEASQEALGVGREALQLSWDCLRKTGNLSSASVLCVLEQVMKDPPQPGAYSILAAAGPGFCSELVLLRWHGR